MVALPLKEPKSLPQPKEISCGLNPAYLVAPWHHALPLLHHVLPPASTHPSSGPRSNSALYMLPPRLRIFSPPFFNQLTPHMRTQFNHHFLETCPW